MLNFNQADVRVLGALKKMRAPEMQPLFEFFKKQLEDSKNALVLSDDDRFRSLQGRAKYLQDLVDAVDNAADIPERV